MLKISKRIGSLVLVFTMAATIFSASAASTYSRSDLDDKTVSGAYFFLSNITTLTVDTPILTTCTVKSSGNSQFIFNPKTSGYNRSLSSHTIQINSGGIGGVSISLGGGYISTTGSNNEKVYTFNTDAIYYTVNQSIWRLYYYQEIHGATNILKQSNGTPIATVVLSTYIAW